VQIAIYKTKKKLIPNYKHKYFFLGLPKLRLIVIAISLWENPLCRWPWWMSPVGEEKTGIWKRLQVIFNGIEGGRILCCYKYVKVVLTCVLVSYVSMGRSPYRRGCRQFLWQTADLGVTSVVIIGGEGLFDCHVAAAPKGYQRRWFVRTKFHANGTYRLHFQGRRYFWI